MNYNLVPIDPTDTVILQIKSKAAFLMGWFPSIIVLNALSIISEHILLSIKYYMVYSVCKARICCNFPSIRSDSPSV